ncbi:hypothetical protein [Pseudorhodoplanes sinuspersici]|nr:hypothetical protein [Pseudorhodoplanes sinuspersici]
MTDGPVLVIDGPAPTIGGMMVVTGAERFCVGSTGGGLRPPAPSSVDPIGIPTGPTRVAAAIPVGDEADAAGRAKSALAPGAQVPDAFPSVPPPSKVVGTVGTIDPCIPDIVGIICKPGMPDTAIDEPSEACGIELPKPEHIDTLLVEGPVDGTPDAVGLTPRFVSSVAPSGMPVAGTGAAGPIPSGDVVPSNGGVGAPIGLICARAGPHGSTSPMTPINNQRFMTAAPFVADAAAITRAIDDRRSA